MQSCSWYCVRCSTRISAHTLECIYPLKYQSRVSKYDVSCFILVSSSYLASLFLLSFLCDWAALDYILFSEYILLYRVTNRRIIKYLVGTSMLPSKQNTFVSFEFLHIDVEALVKPLTQLSDIDLYNILCNFWMFLLVFLFNHLPCSFPFLIPSL